MENELLHATKSMRENQRNYFKSRTKDALRTSIEAEKQVDQIILKMVSKKPNSIKIWIGVGDRVRVRFDDKRSFKGNIVDVDEDGTYSIRLDDGKLMLVDKFESITEL